jgi:hypothetical protein
VNYMHQVYSDPTLYASYFWWWKFYEVQNIANYLTRDWVQVR